MRQRKRSFPAAVALIIAPLALASCDRDEGIRVYRSPKDRMVASAASLDMRDAPTSAAASRLTWDLPEGWQDQLGADAMRFATITDARAEHGASITVTSLPSRAGGLLANINRWRDQLDLPPIEESQLPEVVRPFDGTQLPTVLVELIGPPAAEGGESRRMLAAIFEQPDATWFFKVVDSRAVIDQAEQDIMAIFRSIRPAQVAEASVAPTIASAPDAALTFTVPTGWREDPSPRTARITTIVPEGDPSTEIAVTSFPGDVGGELANVNRWRGQLSLPPVATLDAEETTGATINSLPARVYRFSRAGAEPGRPGIIVAFVMHDGKSWFFKMSGPIEALDSHRSAFVEFIESVRFTQP